MVVFNNPQNHQPIVAVFGADDLPRSGPAVPPNMILGIFYFWSQKQQKGGQQSAK